MGPMEFPKAASAPRQQCCRRRCRSRSRGCHHPQRCLLPAHSEKTVSCQAPSKYGSSMGSMEFPNVASAHSAVHARDEHATVRYLPHMVAPWDPWSFQRRQAYRESGVTVDGARVEGNDATVDKDTTTLPINETPQNPSIAKYGSSMGPWSFQRWQAHSLCMQEANSHQSDTFRIC
jgi:hypothetical protein